MAGTERQRGARARAEGGERARGGRAGAGQDKARDERSQSSGPPLRAREAKRNGRAGAPSAASAAAEEPVAAGAHAMIDLEFLRGLIGAVDASGIDSIEISRAGTRIRISKTPPAAPALPVPAVAPAPVVALQTQPASVGLVAAAPVGAIAAEALSAGAEPARSDLLEVKSPMVGTFYRAPAPEAPPYVEVGSYVTKGQTLCILEAMKLMNELESEVEGVVREVLVDNTEPVEFGQVLFRVEPAKR